MLRAMANRKAKVARALDGQVALVTGGGKGHGRAIALALAARGVRVVVTGRAERALGETVGEIANAGGKARHLAGDVRDAAHVRAAIARAVDVFGGLDIVIATASLSGPDAVGAASTFHAALVEMKGPGRLLSVRSGALDEPLDAKRDAHGTRDANDANDANWIGATLALAHDVAARGITSNAITVVRAGTGTGADTELRGAGLVVEPEEVAELVVFLCSSGGDAISGQAIAMGAASSRA
jgi:3-oxoacyl-[acyl-carrier protein] reductase